MTTKGAATIDLCGPWQMAWSAQPDQCLCTVEQAQASGLVFYPCEVPGNFELDLFALGKLPDPFFGNNAIEVRRATERCHVFYGRSFDVPSPQGAVLVFEGLDCFADVYLNGTLAARTDNMLIPHEVPVEPLLRPGRNELFVHIRPALLEALDKEYPPLVSGLPINLESLYVRKAPHMYGWDIMPRFLSAGMYRPVRLELRPAEGISELFLRTVELVGGAAHAVMDLHYRVRCGLEEGYDLAVTMEHGGQRVQAVVPVRFVAGHARFSVEQPALWWPRGSGEANLYDVRVALRKDGEILDERSFAFGIRTVALRRTPVTTSTGEGEFVFLVNGRRVFVKGTNWVPVDAFHSRDRQRIPAVMDMVNDLNCNMVRCWGGNVYEDDLFYDLCDRSGVLVWQDFAMACGVYPQDEVFGQALAAEAAAVVKRLRNHACVALWSGDNECDWAYYWGGTGVDPNTNLLTRKVLPEVLRLHDGTRPYVGSSPFFDQGYGQERFGDYLSEMHLWGPRDYYKSAFYTTSLCHFVSEIGYHGCPAPQSVAKFISPDKLWPNLPNDEWLLHSTSPIPEAHVYDYRVALMNKQIAELFADAPDSLEEFSFLSQVVQAEAKKFFIELFRMAKWRRTGILWWNLMDGWPQFSDAVVDYYYEKKLAYTYIRNSQQDICVMMEEPKNWAQAVIAANDTPRDVVLTVEIRDVDSGDTVFTGTFPVPADSSVVLGQVPYIRNRQRFFALRWSGDACGANHYLAGQPPFRAADYRRWLRASGLFAPALASMQDNGTWTAKEQ